MVYKFWVEEQPNDYGSNLQTQEFDNFDDAFDYANSGLITFLHMVPCEDGVCDDEADDIVWSWDSYRDKDDTLNYIRQIYPDYCPNCEPELTEGRKLDKYKNVTDAIYDQLDVPKKALPIFKQFNAAGKCNKYDPKKEICWGRNDSIRVYVENQEDLEYAKKIAELYDCPIEEGTVRAMITKIDSDGEMYREPGVKYYVDIFTEPGQQNESLEEAFDGEAVDDFDLDELEFQNSASRSNKAFEKEMDRRDDILQALTNGEYELRMLDPDEFANTEIPEDDLELEDIEETYDPKIAKDFDYANDDLLDNIEVWVLDNLIAKVNLDLKITRDFDYDIEQAQDEWDEGGYYINEIWPEFKADNLPVDSLEFIDYNTETEAETPISQEEAYSRIGIETPEDEKQFKKDLYEYVYNYIADYVNDNNRIDLFAEDIIDDYESRY